MIRNNYLFDVIIIARFPFLLISTITYCQVIRNVIEIVNVTVFESYSFITSLKISLPVRVLLMKNVIE